jgi:hypothetical protein
VASNIYLFLVYNSEYFGSEDNQINSQSAATFNAVVLKPN